VQPGEAYPAQRVRLGRGDVVFTYTDGVTDAASFDRERYGRARLHAGVLELLTRDQSASATRVLDQTLWHVRAFSGLAERADDETAVVIRMT
jgi:sigma-B regulation protein RsbU (phosphoserine phosphatase)